MHGEPARRRKRVRRTRSRSMTRTRTRSRSRRRRSGINGVGGVTWPPPQALRWTHVVELEHLVLEVLGDAVYAELAGVHGHTRVHRCDGVVVVHCLLALIDGALPHRNTDPNLPRRNMLRKEAPRGVRRGGKAMVRTRNELEPSCGTQRDVVPALQPRLQAADLARKGAVCWLWDCFTPFRRQRASPARPVQRMGAPEHPSTAGEAVRCLPLSHLPSLACVLPAEV